MRALTAVSLSLSRLITARSYAWASDLRDKAQPKTINMNRYNIVPSIILCKYIKRLRTCAMRPSRDLDMLASCSCGRCRRNCLGRSLARSRGGDGRTGSPAELRQMQTTVHMQRLE